MTTPITYPGAKTFANVGVETVQGTAAASTAVTMPLDSFDAQDTPATIDDVSMTGDMAELTGMQLGGIHSEFTGSGPYLGDYTPLLLHNILGDLSEDGVYTGAGTTVLSAQANPGATSITVGTSLTSGMVVAIGATTSHAEIRTLTSTGVSPTFLTPLAYAHPSTEIVRPVAAPFTHAESLLNSGTAQSQSLTLVDWLGLTPTVQARAYTGCCLSELTLKGSAESEFIQVGFKGIGWKSAPAAAVPVAAVTAATPLASWRSLWGIGGPASAGTLVKNVASWEITITRKVKAFFTGQNSQNPYIIQRGGLRVTGKLEIPVPSDETHLGYLLNNTQPSLQWVVSNGLAGANLLSLQVDIAKAAYTSTKANKAEAVGYSVAFQSVKSATLAGASGGTSPIKVTTQNAVSQAYGS